MKFKNSDFFVFKKIIRIFVTFNSHYINKLIKITNTNNILNKPLKKLLLNLRAVFYYIV